MESYTLWNGKGSSSIFKIGGRFESIAWEKLKDTTLEYEKRVKKKSHGQLKINIYIGNATSRDGDV